MTPRPCLDCAEPVPEMLDRNGRRAHRQPLRCPFCRYEHQRARAKANLRKFTEAHPGYFRDWKRKQRERVMEALTGEREQERRTA